jgi:tRNA (guanosine-2'-O-)-methyltransferase
LTPERYARILRVLDRRQPDLTVLMERVGKSHNFSAILRNCDAVGVLEAHVVPPEAGLDLHRASSAGTNKWVRVRRHGTLADALGVLEGDGFSVLAAHPGDGAVDYREWDFTEPTCLLMGTELHGLSEEARASVDRLVSIPMVGMARSLNVSVAASLLLFEAFRQRSAAGLYDAPRLSPELRARLAFEWAYPRLAGDCGARGAPYPVLDGEGQIVQDS